LMGSGSVYTNLSDFIKYVQLHMNYGISKGQCLVNRQYLYSMYTIRTNDYGLGTYIGKIDSLYFINHNGSGYGYSATFLWFPEYNLGSVILCNNQCNTYEICKNIMDKYIKIQHCVKNKSVTRLMDSLNGRFFDEPEVFNIAGTRICTTDTLFKPDWGSYVGTYTMNFNGMVFKWPARLVFALGYHPQKVTIAHKGQVLKIRSNFGESILHEYSPGMFFTDGGELLDFTSEQPTYKNIQLTKVK
jgi:hypothetical protein